METFNHLTVTASRKTVYVPEERLKRAFGFRIRTVYPGGLYASCTFSIPLFADEQLMIRGGDYLMVKNGNTLVFDGYIVNITPAPFGQIGNTEIEVSGAWDYILRQQGINKRWRDNRLDDKVWTFSANLTGDGDSQCTVDRQNRLRFTPKGVAWASGDYAAVRYTQPYGQTTKRLTYSYAFSELASQSPKTVLHYDSAGPTYTELPNLCDGDLTTTHARTITTGDYLYVDMLEETSRNALYVHMGTTPNANASTMTAEYPSVDTSGNVTWNALTITDGTISAGKTLAVDGSITFTRPADLAKVAVDGKSHAWIRLIFSANLTGGMTIREIYIQETQAWEISVWRSTGGSFTQMTNASGETYGTGTTTVITATGTGSIDVTLATPSRYVELRLYSLAAQTAIENGTIYGEFNTLRVYSETGSINLYEIANDIRAYTGMSADTTWLNASTMTYDLAPAFLTNGYEYYADILARAANFGDTSGNQVAYGLKPSRFTSDGNPALFLEARADPLTATTFDYQVTTKSAQVPALRYDSGSIRNWIVVQYTDETGASLTLDPDEQATLTDATSTTAYGEKMLIVNAGNTDAAGALEYGKRMLARYKDPIISVTGPIVIQDYLLNSSGVAIPASELIAGKMLKIMDIPNVQGVIAQTEYDDTNKTASLSLGAPDDYTTFLARLANQMQLSKIG